MSKRSPNHLKYITDKDKLPNALVYAWGAIWALVLLFFTPGFFAAVIQYEGILAWTALATAGAGLALYGLYSNKNLTFEITGAYVLIAGPIGYCVTELALCVQELISTGTTQRVPTAIYALWPAFALLRRIIWLHNKRNVAKSVPLDEEDQ